jgi:hypothetical protein
LSRPSEPDFKQTDTNDKVWRDINSYEMDRILEDIYQIKAFMNLAEPSQEKSVVTRLDDYRKSD